MVSCAGEPGATAQEGAQEGAQIAIGGSTGAGSTGDADDSDTQDQTTGVFHHMYM